MTNRFLQRSTLTQPQNSFSTPLLFEADNEAFQKFRFDLESVLLEIETNYNDESRTLHRNDAMKPHTRQVGPMNSTADEFDLDIDARWI